MSEIPSIPCACATLRRASRAVSQLYDEVLRPTGLKSTQFTLLQIMAGAGPVTQARLAQLLALDSTTLSRNVKVLEGNGWIRGREGKDRRERHLSLTPTGRSLVRKGKSAWRKAQDRLKAALGGEDSWAALFEAAHGATRASRSNG